MNIFKGFYIYYLNQEIQLQHYRSSKGTFCVNLFLWNNCEEKASAFQKQHTLFAMYVSDIANICLQWTKRL